MLPEARDDGITVPLEEEHMANGGGGSSSDDDEKAIPAQKTLSTRMYIMAWIIVIVGGLALTLVVSITGLNIALVIGLSVPIAIAIMGGCAVLLYMHRRYRRHDKTLFDD